MKKFDYLRPKTLEEALSLLNQHGKKAKLIAGGTDVIVMIKQKTMSPDVLISLRGVPGLDQIQYDGSLRIGAMVTHRAHREVRFDQKGILCPSGCCRCPRFHSDPECSDDRG